MKPDRQIRYARYLGILFCLAGFAAIGLGWDGAARTAQPDSQLPYLLSGGAVGLGLIVFGVGLILIAQIRSERTRLQGVVDLMGPAVKRLVPQVEAQADKGPEPFLFQVGHARVFALVCSLAGFVAIALGWMGMARSAAADQQLPYIVSGGMGGVGLITFGVGVLLVAQIRTERQRMMTVLEVFAIGLSRATEGGSISVEEGAAGEPPPGTLVVAGSSTFHRPDCRLIQGKAGLDRLTLGVAQSSGLSPCRVCDPLGTSSADTDVTDRIGTIPPSPGPPLEEPTTNQLGAEQAPLGSDEGTR